MSYERILLGVLAAVVVCAGAGICFGGPVIVVEPGELEFSALEGGSIPPAQILYISNSGTGKLEWVVEPNEPCGWIVIEPASGGCVDETDEVTIGVDFAGLSVGEYSCELTITDPDAENSPQVVMVNLLLQVPSEIRVPDDYKTIQAAIDAALDGDTVIVDVGTYVENINFGGKDIVLTSTNPVDPNVVAATVIDGGVDGYIVTFSGSETADCILTGFTITNGTSIAIRGYYTHATINNCVITGNDWVGLYCCDGRISNCTISNNRAAWGGGLYDCDGTISNCTIADNDAGYYSSEGGGLYDCDGKISNCVIRGNFAGHGGGGLADCGGEITNCTITGNRASFGGGLYDCEGTIENCTITSNSVYIEGGGLHSCTWGKIASCIIVGNSADNAGDQLYLSSVPSYSCIQDWHAGGEGNIDIDPLFVDTSSEDPAEWNLHLRPESFCIDGGDPNRIIAPGEVDLDGNERLVDGDNDGVVIVDMGAYESPLYDNPVIRVSAIDFEFHVLEGGVSPDDQILMIRNGGGGTLDWEITEDCTWLSVSPISGSSVGETDEVVLSVDSSGMTYGAHEVSLSVKSTHAINSSLEAEVILYVNKELYVPKDYATIQSAIDGGIDGDTIVVGIGKYLENINFGGKNIILTSTNPDDSGVVSATVIDGGGLGSVVTFRGNEIESCELKGFTITRGIGTIPEFLIYRCGGGIHGNGTNATISNCTITGNVAEGRGGGLHDCDGTIENCAITGNSAVKFTGGGLYGCSGVIINCTITGNTANYGGGMSWCGGEIANCIVVGNIADTSDDQLNNCSTPTYSCIEDWTGGVEGNIDKDPEFVEVGYWDPNDTPEDETDDFWVEGDCHLTWDSPCVDAGDPNFVGEAKVDIDGEPRVMGARVDMGADEVGPKQADFTRNGRIDIEDFAVFSRSWDTQPTSENWYILCDLFEDDIIDINDLAAFAADWIWIADWY